MLRLDAGRTASLDKVKPTAPGSHVRSRLLASSAVLLGRVTHAPFSSSSSSVPRVSVRARAADDDEGGSRTTYAPGYDPNAPRKTPTPRAPKVTRTVTVQLEDLKPGQELEGDVVKVEQFGAFVNIGAKSDGLVHISQLSDSGFTKNPNDIVKVGQRVKVKVMSYDASKERLALTMKGMGSVTAAAAADDQDVDEEEEEEDEEAGSENDFELPDGDEDEGEEEDEEETDVDNFDIPDGQDLVFPDELPGSFFLVPEYEESEGELTAEGLADYEANEEEYQYKFQHTEDGVPLPLYERVVGKVMRVEQFGAFVSFAGPGGKQLEGLLHISEMKAPASQLTAEELEEYDPEEQEEDENTGLYDDYSHNEYVDVGEISDATELYKVGDDITAFYIGTADFDEDGRGGGINLSQFTDAELLGASVEVSTPDEEEEVLDDGEFEVDEEMAEDFEDDSLAAVDPVRILEEDDEVEPTAAELAAIISGNNGRRGGRFGDRGEEEEDDPPADKEEMAGNAETHQRGSTFVANSMLLKDGRMFLGQLPSRPARRGGALAEMPDLSSLERQELDFELDVSELQDYWTDALTAEVPKGSMRKAGYKLQISEDGTVEEVKRTGADGKEVEVSDDVFQDFSLAGDLNQRAQAFYDDLMDEEDEAELPTRAYRRPVPN